MLNQLPRTSRYQVAVHNDDERAEKLAALVDWNQHDQRPYTPPAEMWTLEAELLALIADLLANQRADFHQIHSRNQRRKDPKPTPRPEMALDRARKRAEITQHEDVVRRMLPWKQ